MENTVCFPKYANVNERSKRNVLSQHKYVSLLPFLKKTVLRNTGNIWVQLKLKKFGFVLFQAIKTKVKLN